MKNTSALVAFICLSLSLSACQTLHNSDDNRKGMCNEIKSRMIFSGNTANQNKAFQERNDQAKLSESYHDEGCL
jgi:hypothetical protein